MKHIAPVLLMAFVLSAVPAPAPAQAAATEIAVTGTGTVTLPPDLATVDAAVETNAPNAGEAVSQNNAIYDRVVASLQKLGIARADVSLSYYNVSYTPKPTPAELASQPQQRWGYTVSRGFTVKVRAIDKAGGVVDACTAAGATAINGVSFGLADTQAPRAKAMREAVAQARAEAEALAAAAGLHIVAIKRIDLGGAAPGPVPLMRMAAAAPAAPTQFDQSNVSVSVTVGATFTAAP